MEDVKALLEEQNRLMKSLREKVDAGERQGKNMQKESTEAIEAISARLDAIEFDEIKKSTKTLETRLEDIEVKMLRPMQESLSHQAQESEAKRKADGILSAYNRWIRKGEKSLTDEEIKSLSVDQDPQGGYMVPVQRATDITRKLVEYSPVRELASVVRISSGDQFDVPVEGVTSFAASWVGERGTRSETTAGNLKMEKIPVHEMYAQPFVTQKMLDDAEYNVEGWLMEALTKAFAVKEGAAFVAGDGVSQPEGVLSASAITATNSGDANLITADGLVSLFYALPEFYVRNATWLMKRSTVAAVRKLKDSYGAYVWQPGLAVGQPGTILDRPYREATDMPAIAANAYPIVFGDFQAGYKIVDRVDMRQLRDPYSNKPFVSYYTTRRVGGQVILAEALVKQKVSA